MFLLKLLINCFCSKACNIQEAAEAVLRFHTVHNLDGADADTVLRDEQLLHHHRLLGPEEEAHPGPRGRRARDHRHAHHPGRQVKTQSIACWFHVDRSILPFFWRAGVQHCRKYYMFFNLLVRSGPPAQILSNGPMTRPAARSQAAIVTVSMAADLSEQGSWISWDQHQHC